MKETELKISGKKLFERMKTESGKTSQVKESAGQTGRISVHGIITDDEKNLIDEYIEIAMNECMTVTNRYLGACRFTSKADPSDTRHNIYSLHVAMPVNYPEEAFLSLEGIIGNIVVNRSLQQWYMLARSDDASLCSSKIQLYMQQLQETLSLRKRP